MNGNGRQDGNELSARMGWRRYMGRHYPESRFDGFTRVDGTIAFYVCAQSLVGPSSIVLDIGCGRGACADDPVGVRRELRIFKGKCSRVIGIDVDEGTRGNPSGDEFRLHQRLAPSLFRATIFAFARKK